MEFTLNDLQRQRVEEHLALVEQVLRRSIKTNETVDGMGHDDLYQEGCIALCRAAVSYREEMGAFPAYARTVIRNYLLDRCREIQSARKNLPLLSLDAFAEMGAPEPVSPFHMEDLISDVSSDALLSHFRNRYQAAHPPPDDAFDALRARLLLHDLFLLADEEQTLLVRHRLHGCSLAETARREGMSVKRVRHRLKALYRAYFAQKETKQKEL